MGVASALAYLHQECENQVIHRDVKSSNIMLDEGFNAKLGDFGLARQIEHNKSPDATIAAGTIGYLVQMLVGEAEVPIVPRTKYRDHYRNQIIITNSTSINNYTNSTMLPPP